VAVLAMTRRVFLLALGCLGIRPRASDAMTEVKHGPNPAWTTPVTGEFSARVVGHYTPTPDLAAAGVTESAFSSDRPVKRRAELLALRTAFVDWWIAVYVAQEATRSEAIAQWQGLIDHLRETAVTTGTGGALGTGGSGGAGADGGVGGNSSSTARLAPCSPGMWPRSR